MDLTEIFQLVRKYSGKYFKIFSSIKTELKLGSLHFSFSFYTHIKVLAVLNLPNKNEKEKNTSILLQILTKLLPFLYRQILKKYS